MNKEQNLNEPQSQQLNITGVIGSDTITLTKDELETFLQDWDQGYGSWSDTSRRIVCFLGMDEIECKEHKLIEEIQRKQHLHDLQWHENMNSLYTWDEDGFCDGFTK